MQIKMMANSRHRKDDLTGMTHTPPPSVSLSSHSPSYVEHAIRKTCVRLVKISPVPVGVIVNPRRRRVVDVTEVMTGTAASEICVEDCRMDVDRTSSSAEEVAEVMSLAVGLRVSILFETAKQHVQKLFPPKTQELGLTAVKPESI